MPVPFPCAAPPEMIWLIVAVIAATAAGMLIFKSIEAGNATVASLIEAAHPLFTAFFAWILFRQNTVNTAMIPGALSIPAGVVIAARANR